MVRRMLRWIIFLSNITNITVKVVCINISIHPFSVPRILFGVARGAGAYDILCMINYLKVLQILNYSSIKKKSQMPDVFVQMKINPQLSTCGDGL